MFEGWKHNLIVQIKTKEVGTRAITVRCHNRSWISQVATREKSCPSTPVIPQRSSKCAPPLYFWSAFGRSRLFSHSEGDGLRTCLRKAVDVRKKLLFFYCVLWSVGATKSWRETFSSPKCRCAYVAFIVLMFAVTFSRSLWKWRRSRTTHTVVWWLGPVEENNFRGLYLTNKRKKTEKLWTMLDSFGVWFLEYFLPVLPTFVLIIIIADIVPWLVVPILLGQLVPLSSNASWQWEKKIYTSMQRDPS